MLFTDVIRTKRDGGALSDEQIQFFVDGLADGSIPAEQVSALAMAIFLNSMSFEEIGKLTMCMANSGTVLEWQDLDLGGPVVDKHSTGQTGGVCRSFYDQQNCCGTGQNYGITGWSGALSGDPGQ